MRNLLPFCLSFLLVFPLIMPNYAAELDPSVLPYKKQLKDKILDGLIFSESKVTSNESIINGKKSVNQEFFVVK